MWLLRLVFWLCWFSGVCWFAGLVGFDLFIVFVGFCFVVLGVVSCGLGLLVCVLVSISRMFVVWVYEFGLCCLCVRADWYGGFGGFILVTVWCLRLALWLPVGGLFCVLCLVGWC